jgi:hypothetical protein
MVNRKEECEYRGTFFEARRHGYGSIWNQRTGHRYEGDWVYGATCGKVTINTNITRFQKRK